MSFLLRPYQQDLLDRLNERWDRGYASSLLCQLPTGGGKTMLLSVVAKEALEMMECLKLDEKVLVLAHREELINQAVEKLEAITNEPVGIIKSGVKPNYDLNIQVGSVQSMARRMEKCPKFGLIIIDEAHHASSGSYKKIIDNHKGRILGVTATPIRLDGKGFRGVFDELICGVTVSELIEMGSLSPYKYYASERSMSTEGVGKQGGDFKASAIEAENPAEIVANQVIESYNRHLRGKQAVIFAVSVAHSIAITEALRSTGIRAHHLDGMTETSERKSAMDLFRNKEIQILSNCALFDEGLDIPSLDGVILARPTASLSRYLQMVGRGLRVSEGKEHAIIVDLADNYERLGMPADDREWTLDGIEKKKRDKKTTTRKRNEITGEVETVSIFDTGTQFIEIAGQSVVMTPELLEWIEKCDAILLERTMKERKAAWCAYRLLESKIEPPLEAWKYLGKKLGYHHGWAKYKADEWTQTK